jgi:hypothetical protein
VRYRRPYALRFTSSFSNWNTKTAINPNPATTHNDLRAHFGVDARSAPAPAANTTGADDCVIATPTLMRCGLRMLDRDRRNLTRTVFMFLFTNFFLPSPSVVI